MAEGTAIEIYGPETKYFESLGKHLSIFEEEIHAFERCIQFNIDRSYRKQEDYDNV